MLIEKKSETGAIIYSIVVEVIKHELSGDDDYIELWEMRAGNVPFANEDELNVLKHKIDEALNPEDSEGFTEAVSIHLVNDIVVNITDDFLNNLEWRKTNISMN